jgi:hypothetical protein
MKKKTNNFIKKMLFIAIKPENFNKDNLMLGDMESVAIYVDKNGVLYLKEIVEGDD